MPDSDTPLIHPAPRLNRRGEAWRVSWYDAEGIRRHKQFPDKAGAWDFYQERTAEHVGDEDLLLSTEERLQLVRLRRHAAATGEPLADLVSRAIEGSRNAVRHKTLEDAWQWYETDMFKRRNRPAYRRSAAEEIRPFVRAHRRLSPGAITARDVLAYLVGTIATDSRRATARNRICTFLRAVGADIKPADIRWAVVKTDERHVAFWHVPEVTAFLAAAPEVYAIPFALCFFAGIRPAGELPRLRWDDLDFPGRTLRIRGEVDKTRRAYRLYNLPDNFWAWAALGHQRLAPKGPKVLQRTYRNSRAAAAKVIADQGLPPWPHDCTRHTFGTHAYHRGLEWAVATMRHVSGFKVFAERYKGEVSALDGRAYFGIYPGAVPLQDRLASKK
jgi:integrase